MYLVLRVLKKHTTAQYCITILLGIVTFHHFATIKGIQPLTPLLGSQSRHGDAQLLAHQMGHVACIHLRVNHLFRIGDVNCNLIFDI